jgi:hypothetical protein
MPILIF